MDVLLTVKSNPGISIFIFWGHNKTLGTAQNEEMFWYLWFILALVCLDRLQLVNPPSGWVDLAVSERKALVICILNFKFSKVFLAEHCCQCSLDYNWSIWTLQATICHIYGINVMILPTRAVAIITIFVNCNYFSYLQLFFIFVITVNSLF